MAGLSCGKKLAGKGHVVQLFDKGRGPGGRMSTRRMASNKGEIAFDHGAQYFTVRDPAFAEEVSGWERADTAAHWPAAGTDAWVGIPAMNAPLRQMAAGLDVRWATRITAIHGEPKCWRLKHDDKDDCIFDAVIIATPAEQVAPLITAYDQDIAAQAEEAESDPCWTVMAAFEEALPVSADIIRDTGAIGWAARNSAKPERDGPESWVIQGTAKWSSTHLEQHAEKIEAALLSAFIDVTGIEAAEPFIASAHRWRYAKAGKSNNADGMIWNDELKLGVCGDWLIGPRVECAWLSGARLADAI